MNTTRLPASSADRWVNCPMSANVLPVVPQEDNEAAREGRQAHKWAANLLTDPDYPRPDYATDEMEWMVRTYVDAVTGVAGVLNIVVEGEYIATYVNKLNKCVIDAYVWDRANNTLHVFEFKTGRTPVDPESSWQLRDYVVALSSNINVNDDTKYIPYVVQPRSLDGIGIKARIWHKSDLIKMTETLRDAATRAISEPDVACTGTHCQYCPLTAQCETLGKEVDEFNPVLIACHNLDDTALSATITDIRRKAKLLQARLDGLELDAVHRITHGRQLPDYTLAPSMSHKKWTVPDDTVIAFGSLFGLDLAKPVATVTPTQAFQVAKSHNVDPEILSTYIESVAGALKLTYKPITTKKDK